MRASLFLCPATIVITATATRSSACVCVDSSAILTRMPRRPTDTLSQRALVMELRMSIDAAMAGHRRGVQRVRRLVAENPRSVWGTHVLYNIGKHRAAWLRELVDTDDAALAEAFTRVRELPYGREAS